MCLGTCAMCTVEARVETRRDELRVPTSSRKEFMVSGLGLGFICVVCWYSVVIAISKLSEPDANDLFSDFPMPTSLLCCIYDSCFIVG